jgi:hypothetical protein
VIYEYGLKYQNYKDAQKLYIRHSKRAALYYYFFIWVLPILGCLLAIFGLAALFEIGPVWVRYFRGLYVVGLWFALFIPIMRIFTVRRCWKQLVPPNTPGKGMKAEIHVTLEFNAEQFISAIPGRSEGRFFWSAVQDFAEDVKIALIFIHKKRFIFIPKPALPEAAWSELRVLITNRTKAA